MILPTYTQNSLEDIIRQWRQANNHQPQQQSRNIGTIKSSITVVIWRVVTPKEKERHPSSLKGQKMKVLEI